MSNFVTIDESVADESKKS